MEYDPDVETAARKDYKDETFGKAFNRARKNKRPTFFWRGKEYTTELAGSKPAAPTKTGDAAMFRGPQGANLVSRQEQRYPGVRERSEDSPMARGSQGANLSPRQEQRYPGMREEAASDESGRFRSRRSDDDSMKYRGERSYIAKPDEPAGPTAEQLARYEEMMRPGRDAIEPIMPEAALIGGLGALRTTVGSLRGASARRPVVESATKPVAKRTEPKMRGDETPLPGRTEPYMTREPRDLVSAANRRAAEEAAKESARRKPEFRSRVAERMEEREAGYKTGGTVKAHRGDGICKRGHTKGVMR